MYYTNKDIRIAMIEADVSQVELAERMGYCIAHINRLLREEPMKEKIHDLIMRTLKEIKAENRAKAIEGAMTREEVSAYLGDLPRVNKMLDALCDDDVETYFNKEVIDEYLDTHDEFDTIRLATALNHAIIK